jgi:hypothetical protein
MGHILCVIAHTPGKLVQLYQFHDIKPATLKRIPEPVVWEDKPSEVPGE